METRSEAPAATGTVLGTFDVVLQGDQASVTYGTVTQMQSTAEGVAREVPLIVGALLFSQRQMRAVNDPARHAAVDEIAAVCASARESRLVARSPTATSRVVATYRVELVANGSFRINLDQKLEGILVDSAASLTTGALARELLTTLGEPYRSFFREMLEAATNYWRDRRPSAVESTWDWGVALPRLNQLMRQGAPSTAPPQTCEACHALRPAGYPCLRCGTSPGLTQSLLNPPSVPFGTLAPPPTVAPPAPVAPTPTFAPPAPVPAPLAATVTAPPLLPPAPAGAEERTIVPAGDAPVAVPAGEVNPRDAWPLAGLGRRLGAWALDVISGGILAAIGALGLTSILLATSAFGPADDPRQFAGIVAVVILGLYLTLGWTKGETLGMLACNLRLLRADKRLPCGLFRAMLRGLGSLLLVVIALAVFSGIWILDNQLPFIQGVADLAVRVIGGVIALYILWVGSAQPILGGGIRQTLGDRVAGTIVVVRKS